jgi:hypothetical protein
MTNGVGPQLCGVRQIAEDLLCGQRPIVYLRRLACLVVQSGHRGPERVDIPVAEVSSGGFTPLALDP